MSQLEFKKIDNPKNYQNFIIENSGKFTQADFYGDWHLNLGKGVYHFIILNQDKPVLFMQIIEINALFNQKFLYSPYGPIYKKEFLKEILPVLKNGLIKEFKNTKNFFCRLDFCPTLNKEQEDLIKKYFWKSNKKTYKGSLFQPRDEWVLDLNKEEDEIYKNIDKKNRYCIRQAEKRGVVVEIITDQFNRYFEEFYKLLLETSKRNNFGIHKKEYYQEIFNSIQKNKNGYLVRSIYKGKINDSLLFLNFGKTTMFIFGASSDLNRTLPTAHLAQWHSILYAKSIGMDLYNFGGISTDSDPIPGLEKVTRFKKRFGGYIFKHSQYFDLIINRFWYLLFIIRKFIK